MWLVMELVLHPVVAIARVGEVFNTHSRLDGGKNRLSVGSVSSVVTKEGRLACPLGRGGGSSNGCEPQYTDE